MTVLNLDDDSIRKIADGETKRLALGAWYYADRAHINIGLDMRSRAIDECTYAIWILEYIARNGTLFLGGRCGLENCLLMRSLCRESLYLYVEAIQDMDRVIYLVPDRPEHYERRRKLHTMIETRFLDYRLPFDKFLGLDNTGNTDG